MRLPLTLSLVVFQTVVAAFAVAGDGPGDAPKTLTESEKDEVLLVRAMEVLAYGRCSFFGW